MRHEAVKRFVATAILAGGMLYAVPANAAYNAYMTIRGTKQGQLKGESERIAVKSVEHGTSAQASDRSTGLASGRRQHGTITIMKEIDKASPVLFRAQTTNETLEVTIVMESTGAGKGAAPETIELKNAMITSVKTTGTTEAITFTYETIEVTHSNGTKSATDAWDAK